MTAGETQKPTCLGCPRWWRQLRHRGRPPIPTQPVGPTVLAGTLLWTEVTAAKESREGSSEQPAAFKAVTGDVDLENRIPHHLPPEPKSADLILVN